MASEQTCPACGAAVVGEYVPGAIRYSDTLGGHADRHTLVMEAAERSLDGDGPLGGQS